MMQIVIEIHEKDYQSMKNGHIPYSVLSTIINGTPLPKGHGRLIDYGYVMDAIDDWINEGEYDYTNATNYLRNRIRNVPTIIPAERSDK